MQSTVGDRLDVIGEHGYGKHVLVISFSSSNKSSLIFEGLIPKKYKVHYLSISLKDDVSEIEDKFAHSLTYYSYIENIILDYPSFLFFCNSLKRTQYNNLNIKRLTVFNPLDIFKYKSELVLDHKYKFLYGGSGSCHKIAKRFKSKPELQYVSADELNIIAFEDKKYSLNLASNLKKSKLITCNEYKEALWIISEEYKEM